VNTFTLDKKMQKEINSIHKYRGVHPSYQRHGIAKLLMHTIEDTAKSEGRSLLVLDTSPVILQINCINHLII
jgi:GNAT superfamily N-acetyltransferase